MSKKAVDIGRCQNCTKFTSVATFEWAQFSGIDWHYIAPGKPLQNGFIGSFDSKSRAGYLNTNWTMSLADAPEKLEDWRRHYKVEKPHSATGYSIPNILQYPYSVTSPPF